MKTKDNPVQNAFPIEEFDVQERQVTVQVLTLGKRQVTQALFRQLPEESIIHSGTAELKGVPWGRVNYHVGCENIKGSHFHVVWQKDQELKRAIVGFPWLWREGNLPCDFNELEDKFRHAMRVFIYVRILEGWKPKDPHDVNVEIEGQSANIWLEDKVTNYWGSCEPNQKSSKEYIESYIKKDGYSINDRQVIYNNMLDAAIKWKAFKKTWEQSCNQLLQLEQLFIAVSGVWG